MKKHFVLVSVALLLLPAICGTAVDSQESRGERPAERASVIGQAYSTASANEEPALIGEVVFPHEAHVEDLGLDCEECHHETNAARLSLPHEDYFQDLWIDCQICHHQSEAEALAPQSCSVCHHALVGGIADETLSSKVVVHQNCWTCHEVNTGVEASRSCGFCHRGPERR